MLFHKCFEDDVYSVRKLIDIKYILFALLLFYKTINKQKNALNVLVGHFDFFNDETREPMP